MADGSAIVVFVPEADGLLRRIAQPRIPAHVTLLVPFAPPAAIDEPLLDELRLLIGRRRTFELRLDRTERFRGVVYLEPDPPEPFVELVESLVARFPGYPPYGGAFTETVPHLTLATGDDAALAAAEAIAAAAPPIRSTVREAALLVELEPPWATWQVRARLPFGD